MKSDILGIMRFSMVSDTPRGFPALLDKTLEERQREIFDPQRMEQRLAFVENLLLPTLTRQSDQNFRFVALTTTNLPQTYRDRLASLLSKLPQAAVLTLPVTAPLRLGCRQSLRRFCQTDGDRWCTFRVDDDDGLAVDFVARLRAAMGSVERSMAVTCVPGLEIISGAPFRYRLAKKKCASVGLGFVAFRDHSATQDFETIYQLGPHRRVGDHLPVCTLSGPPGFIRLIHPTNISGIGAAPGGYLSDQEADEILIQRFGFESRVAFETAIHR